MSITDTTIRLWKNKKVGEGVIVDIYILSLIRRCMQLLCLDMDRYNTTTRIREMKIALGIFLFGFFTSSDYFASKKYIPLVAKYAV